MTAGDELEKLAKRRVPCFVGYLSPFRLVESDTLSAWEATIENVNKHTWDYAALHEVAGGIDVGLAQPYHLVVSRDGALALPPIPEFRDDQTAVEFINRCLAGLLIGGVYCEAITTDGLDTGSIIDWKYVRVHQSGQAAANRFHQQIRYGQASTMEAIALYKPASVALSALTTAMAIGLATLDRLPTLQGEYLLKGVTGVARRDWGAALANLWIVVEQLLSFLWQRDVVGPTVAKDGSRGRKDQLADTRTWTASARIEMLFQLDTLSSEVFTALGVARKARNELSHQGKHPASQDAHSAYEGVTGLLKAALIDSDLPLFHLDLANHALSDPFASRGRVIGEPKFWMEIPKLPGELELEQAEAALRRPRKEAE